MGDTVQVLSRAGPSGIGGTKRKFSDQTVNLDAEISKYGGLSGRSGDNDGRSQNSPISSHFNLQR